MGGKAKNASADLIKNEGKRLKSDLRGDTNFTQNQLDSIFANLGTTGRGVSRALDRSQSRTLGAMNRLAARTRNSAYAKNDQVTQHLTNRYGTAMGSAINQQMKPANAQAKATALDTVGGQQAAGLLAKGGQLGLKIEQTAAKEAQAGADYAMAAAYQDRAVALAEARLTRKQEEDDANKTQITDAMDQIQEMAANARTRGDAMSMVRSMQQRFNLNQKETKKLEDYVNTLYPEGEGAYVISRLAETPQDANGNSLQTTLDDIDKESLRTNVANWFASGKTLAEAIQAAHQAKMNDDGTPQGTAGYFEELQAYVTRMYATLGESAPPKKKPTPVSWSTTGGTGTGNVASLAQRQQAATATASLVKQRIAQKGGGALGVSDIDAILYQLYQRYGVHVMRSEVVRIAAAQHRPGG